MLGLRLFWGAFCAAVLASTSCDTKDRDTEHQLAQLASNDSTLLARIADVEAKQFFMDDPLTATRAATLDPSKAGYVEIGSGPWCFLLSCDDIRPYADGQKLVLRIGNPYFASFSGVRAKCEFGRRWPHTESRAGGASTGRDSTTAQLAAWMASLRKMEVALPDRLKPGSWNRVELVLAPATAEEIGHISIELTTEQVHLLSP